MICISVYINLPIGSTNNMIMDLTVLILLQYIPQTLLKSLRIIKT